MEQISEKDQPSYGKSTDVHCTRDPGKPNAHGVITAQLYQLIYGVPVSG